MQFWIGNFTSIVLPWSEEIQLSHFRNIHEAFRNHYRGYIVREATMACEFEIVLKKIHVDL